MKTTPKQILYNIASGYKEKTSDTEEINYGNVENKVIDAIGGGGIGYTVTFKVDNEPYYIASCQQGENISEPPIPIVTGKVFSGWLTTDKEIITFPYTPNADIELIANMTTNDFLLKNDEVFLSIGTDYICRDLVNGNGFAGDKDLVGYYYDGTYTYPILITKVSRNRAITKSYMGTGTDKSIIYNGETYYYTATNIPVSGNQSNTGTFNAYKCIDGSTYEQAVTELLNAYFGVTE